MGFYDATTPPTLAYSSDNGVDSITLNLTSLGGPTTDGVEVYAVPPLLSNGPLLWKAVRTTTGTFAITGLSKGRNTFTCIPFNPARNVGHAVGLISVWLGARLDASAMLEHAETTLKNLIWVSKPVFPKDCVVVTDLDTDGLVDKKRLPSAYIQMQSLRPSAHGGMMYPGFKQMIFDVILYSRNVGDNVGRGQVLGSHRPANNDGSGGVGGLELVTKVSGAMEKQVTANGTRFAYVDGGTPKTINIGGDDLSKTVISYQCEVYNGE